MSLTFHPEYLDPLIEAVQQVNSLWQTAVEAVGPPELWDDLEYRMNPALNQVANADHVIFTHWPAGIPIPAGLIGRPVRDVMEYMGRQLGFSSDTNLVHAQRQLREVKKYVLNGNHARFLETWAVVKSLQQVIQEWVSSDDSVTCGVRAAIDANPEARAVLTRFLAYKPQDIPHLADNATKKLDFLEAVARSVGFNMYNGSGPRTLLNPQDIFDAVPFQRPLGFDLPVLPSPMRRTDFYAALLDLIQKTKVLIRSRNTLKTRSKRANRAWLLQKVLDYKVEQGATSARLEQAWDTNMQAARDATLAARRVAGAHTHLYDKRQEDELTRLETHLKLLEAASDELAKWTPDKPLPGLLQEPSLQALLTQGHSIHEELPGLGAFPYMVAPGAAAEAAAAAAAGVEEHKDESDDDEWVPGIRKRYLRS